MKTYLLYLWDNARSSYWFLPSLLAAAALVLAFGLPWLDDALLRSNWELPGWIHTTTETARVTLSAVAGAMIAVTGTVFSITVVTLSLTSQQFGPRLLRRFTSDITTQLTLGVFLSTGFYCLLLLRVVEKGDNPLVAPHLSVMVAVGLSVVSMVMLIVFIHHISTLIQAPNVVAAVAQDLDDAIVRLFPEKIGSPAEAHQPDASSAREQEETIDQDAAVVPARSEGYIQAVASDSLLEWAREHKLVVRLRERPGDFIAIDSPLADVWPTGGDSLESLRTDSLGQSLNELIIVGARRTPRQDVECAVEELVEVAVRSLSPGINDPFTAMNCIDRLGASLGRMANRNPPSDRRYDAEGRLRVIAQPIAFADVLDAAFNQIRQYSRDSVAVTIRLLESLCSIAQHVERQQDWDAIKLHAEMIKGQADEFPAARDREAVQQRFELLMDCDWNRQG